MLGNLKLIYLQREDFAESLSLCDRLLLVDPDSLQDRLDRALALEKLEFFTLAADELERLAQRPELAAQPQALAAVSRRIEALRSAAPAAGRTLH
jgi:regulator of sirC expression with transglutaminase-like and TPR domain